MTRDVPQRQAGNKMNWKGHPDSGKAMVRHQLWLRCQERPSPQRHGQEGWRAAEPQPTASLLGTAGGTPHSVSNPKGTGLNRLTGKLAAERHSQDDRVTPDTPSLPLSQRTCEHACREAVCKFLVNSGRLFLQHRISTFKFFIWEKSILFTRPSKQKCWFLEFF